jgi:trigger factor
MKVEAEKIENNQVVLKIEVPTEEVTKAIDKAYHKLANQVNIPGFRKGKAPRKILEVRLGKEAILDEAFEIVASKAYSEALDEQKLEPVDRPKTDIITLKEGEPVVFKVTVTVKPEIVLGEYKGLKIEKPSVEITEEQVSQQMEDLRNRNAKMIVVEDAVIQKGDFAIIDFEGFVDGQPFKGGEGKGYPLEVGSGSFIPGFEDQLLGVKAGEKKEVNVKFPEDYFVPELAGKEAVFTVTVNDVKRKELPELDDEFVKDVSEFNTIEEFKADVQNKLKEAAEQKAERDFHNNTVKAAVDNVKVDIPDIMVESRIDNMVEDLDINLQNRGSKLEKYLEYVKMDMKALRDSYREAALYNVKTDLVLEAIAKAEEIKVNPEDLEAEIAAMAEGYGRKVEEVRDIILKQGHVAALAGSILRKKAAQIIIDNVVKE